MQRKGLNGFLDKPYTFSYYIGDKSGIAGWVPARMAPSQDHWGYYNAITTYAYDNSLNIYKNLANLFAPRGRALHPMRTAENGCLKTVAYPTGGTLNFEYEFNTAWVANAVKNVGGVRVKKVTQSDAVDNSKLIATEYKYVDEAGRVVVKEIPGVNGPVYMVYDARDRLVFTQDPALRNRGLGEWLLYFYDGLDRPVMTALYKNTAATRESLQANLNVERTPASISFTNPPVADLYVDESTPLSTRYEATNSVTLLPGFDSQAGAVDIIAEVNPNATGTTESMIVNNPSPNISGYEPLIITYYDNYDWPGAKRFSTSYKVNAGANPYATSVTPASSAIGKVTGMKCKVLGKNQWLINTSFYDSDGRKIQALNENITGGTDILTSQYDFSGKQLSSYWAHKNPKSVANPETQAQLRYEFTNNNWISKVYHTLFNSTSSQSKLLTELTYDEAGRVKTKKLGNLETLNYDYNLKGQLKGINAEYARDKNTNHYFGMELSMTTALQHHGWMEIQPE